MEHSWIDFNYETNFMQKWAATQQYQMERYFRI